MSAEVHLIEVIVPGQPAVIEAVIPGRPAVTEVVTRGLTGSKGDPGDTGEPGSTIALISAPISPLIEIRSLLFPAGGTYATGLIGSNIRITAFPVIVPYEVTFSKCIINVTTLQAGSVLRAGIYNTSVNSSNGDYWPKSLICDIGSFDCSTTGQKEITINLTLQPGVYWRALTVNNAGIRCTVNMNVIGLHRIANTAAYGCNADYSHDGNLPSTFPTGSAGHETSYGGCLFLQRGSI